MSIFTVLKWAVPIWLVLMAVSAAVFLPTLSAEVGEGETIRRFTLAATISFSVIMLVVKLVGGEIAASRDPDHRRDEEHDEF